MRALVDQSFEPNEILARALRSILPSFDQLYDLRQRISALSISRDAAVDRYSLLIESLFEPQLMTMSIGRVGWIYRQQMAYLFFLQAKEMAGQERALLTAMLSANDYGAMRMMVYYRIKAVEAARLEKFVQLAEENVLDEYRTMDATPYVSAAEKIRRRVAAVGASGRPPDHPMPAAGVWFDLATKRIDAMSAFEKRLSDNLLSSSGQLEEQAHQDLLINTLAVLISLVLAGGLLTRIWRGKEYAEKIFTSPRPSSTTASRRSSSPMQTPTSSRSTRPSPASPGIRATRC